MKESDSKQSQHQEKQEEMEHQGDANHGYEHKIGLLLKVASKRKERMTDGMKEGYISFSLPSKRCRGSYPQKSAVETEARSTCNIYRM